MKGTEHGSEHATYEGTYQVAAEGWHKLLVKELRVKKNEANNKQSIVGTLEVVEDADAGAQLVHAIYWKDENGKVVDVMFKDRETGEPYNVCEKKIADLIICTGQLEAFEQNFPGDDVCVTDDAVVNAVCRRCKDKYLWGDIKHEPFKTRDGEQKIGMRLHAMARRRPQNEAANDESTGNDEAAVGSSDAGSDDDWS